MVGTVLLLSRELILREGFRLEGIFTYEDILSIIGEDGRNCDRIWGVSPRDDSTPIHIEDHDAFDEVFRAGWDFYVFCA